MPSFARPRRRILIVDDSLTAIMLQKILLTRGPYDVLTARDGLEGVARAVSDQPDLVLLDVVMPRMDGFAACRELKRRAETRRIPVVLVTTRGDAHEMEQGFAAGCDDYVTKPLDGPEFLAKLESLLPR